MKINNGRRNIILTGPVQHGKSGALLDWVKNKSAGGFITPTLNGKKILIDIVTTQTYIYELDEDGNNSIRAGRYIIHNEAFKIGAKIVKKAIENPCPWFVFDEIGKLELNHAGHYNSLINLLNIWKGNMLFVVREQLLYDVMLAFGLDNFEIVTLQQLKSIT